MQVHKQPAKVSEVAEVERSENVMCSTSAGVGVSGDQCLVELSGQATSQSSLY